MDLALLGVKIDPTAARAGGKQVEDAFERMKAKAKSSLDTIDSHVNSLRSSMFNVQNAVIALGATFAATQGIRVFAGFEREMSNVQAVTEATTQDMREMTLVAQELGATTEFTATQAATAMKFLGQAGFTTNQILQATPAALDLAMSASIDLGKAAEITSGIMATFGKDAKQTRQIVDVLAVAAAASQTDIQQMGDAMKYVGPIANSLGITIQDTAAAIGVLSNNGLQGSMAGTGLRRVLSELAQPTAEAEAAINALGLKITDLNPQTNSLTTIISRLALAGLDAGKAFTIFGDRGAPAVLALTRSVPKLAELTARMQDTDGAARRMSDTMHNNLIGDFRSLTSMIEAVAISSGEGGLTGTFRKLVQTTTGVIAALAGLSDPLDQANKGFYEIAETIKILGAVAAGFVAAKLSFHLISIGSAAVQAAIALRSLNFIIAANPIGIVAAGIGLATAALIAYSTHTTEAERRQKTFNESLERHKKLMDEGADAGEAALKRSAMDLRQRAAQAQAEVHGIGSRIEMLKRAHEEQKKMDAEARNRGAGASYESIKTISLAREIKKQEGILKEAESTYNNLTQARGEAFEKLEALQLESLRREAGISAEIQREYEKLREMIIKNEPDPARQKAALDALDRRFKQIKENKPIDQDGNAQLDEFVRGLEVGSVKARNFALFQAKLTDAVRAFKISGEEADEMLQMLSYSMTATPLQRYADSLDTASARQRRLVRETELMDLALRKGLMTQEEYNELLNEQRREIAQGGPLQQWADSLNTAEARTKRLNIEMAKLNEAHATGKISLAGYNEAMRQLNDEMRRSYDLTRLSNEQLIEGLANEKNTMEEKARMREELNYRIERSDLSQTEAFKAGVADQLSTYGNAQQRMMQIGQGTAQAMENGFGQFFDAIIDDIGDAGNAFKNMVASMLRDMARLIAQKKIIEPLMGMIFAGAGGFFGGGAGGGIGKTAGFGDGVTPVPIAHTGGVIGADALAARNVNMGIFSGAPRFHTGGIAGDEVPIIAKRGEGIFTPEQMAALGGTGGNRISIQQTITVTGGKPESKTETKGTDAGLASKIAQFMDNRTRQIVLEMTAPGGPLYQSRV